MSEPVDQGRNTKASVNSDNRDGFSVISLFLGFLDRHFTTFPASVQNIIGLTLLTLLAIISLHAFAAPIVVQGRLFIKESKDEDKHFARFTKMSTGDKDIKTDEYGRWTLQLRGLVPQKIRLVVHRPPTENEDEDDYLASFVLWQPRPILSALFVRDYKVIVHIYRKDSEQRVEVTHRDAASPFAHAAQIFSGISDAYAQNALGPPYILVHLEGLGDVACKDGGWCGTRGESRRLEGFSIRLPNGIGDVQVTYRCCVQDRDYTPWLQEGVFCGTRGQSKRLEGFAIKLTGADARRFNVAYQAHLGDRGDTRLYRNGEPIGTKGKGGQVEAIKVWLEQR